MAANPEANTLLTAQEHRMLNEETKDSAASVAMQAAPQVLAKSAL